LEGEVELLERLAPGLDAALAAAAFLEEISAESKASANRA
jgi:hypothetical protein